MHASANPIPVLPEVHSITVPPGFNLPEASAASIIDKAIRSLTLCPGLKYSTLAQIGQGNSSAIAFKRTIGVLPIVPRMLSCTFMGPKVASGCVCMTLFAPYLSCCERGKIDRPAHGPQQPGFELKACGAYRHVWGLLGVALMILAAAVVQGFQHEVKNLWLDLTAMFKWRTVILAPEGLTLDCRNARHPALHRRCRPCVLAP